MANEYPDPNSAGPVHVPGGPYWVPGVDTSPQHNVYGVDDPAHLERCDDAIIYDDDDDLDDSSDDTDGLEALDFDPLRPLPSVEQPADDGLFEPDAAEVSSDEVSQNLTDTSVEDDEGASGQGDRFRRNSGRGRPRGRPRGRGRGRAGFGRGSRNTNEPFDALKVDRRNTRGRTGIPRGEGRGARKGKRGPLTVIDPGKKFNQLLNRGSHAFISNQFEECAECCIEAVKLNPEIFAAHSLLSEAYHELGRTQDSLDVLFNGALTFRDSSVWWEVVDKVKAVLAHNPHEQAQHLLKAYSNITRLDKHNFEARLAKVEVNRKLGNKIVVVKECERILESDPSNLRVLRMYGEESLNLGLARQAKPLFGRAIEHYMEVQDEEKEDGFTFRELLLYSDLLKEMRMFNHGLEESKRLARWLLGRRHELIWNNRLDDCEWDDEDAPRREEVPGFEPGAYDISTYGQGLPADLRLRLGLFRLELGPDHLDEAMVCRWQ